MPFLFNYQSKILYKKSGEELAFSNADSEFMNLMPSCAHLVNRIDDHPITSG